jgi:hypothetical protein
MTRTASQLWGEGVFYLRPALARTGRVTCCRDFERIASDEDVDKADTITWYRLLPLVGFDARDDVKGHLATFHDGFVLFDVPLDRHRMFEGKVSARIRFEAVDGGPYPYDFQKGFDHVGIFHTRPASAVSIQGLPNCCLDRGLQFRLNFRVAVHACLLLWTFQA